MKDIWEKLKSNPYTIWLMEYKASFLFIPISICLMLFCRLYLNYEGKELDNNVWESFFNIFGMLYAVIAGLILVEEFKRFGDLTEFLELEVNALQDMRDYLIYMDNEIDSKSDLTEEEKVNYKKSQEEAKLKIQESLYTYADDVLKKDWIEMQKKEIKLDSDTTKDLQKLMFHVNTLQISNRSDIVGLEQLMLLISNITTFRTQRIALANKRIPQQLKYLISGMGIFLVCGVCMFSVTSFLLHIILTFITASVMLIIYLLFEDLSNPFNGSWKIPKHDFENFVNKGTI